MIVVSVQESERVSSRQGTIALSRFRKAGSMRRQPSLKWLALFPSLLFIALPIFSATQDSSQQSSTGDVAAAARRSREAKQNSAKSKKVYTDDDLPQHREASRASSNSDASTASPTNPKNPDSANPADAIQAQSKQIDKDKDPEKNPEKIWRKRFSEQRDNIARAEKELDILQREGQKAQVQYYPDPQKAMSEEYTRKDINDKDAKIAAKQQEIAKLKQGLADLEDDLRKSGGDQGWSRE
jgi:hypothetical protein